MEKKEITVTVVKSNNSNFNVWAVSVTGEEQPCAHCKSAYKAMRFMFMLKKQTGLYIADASMAQLREEIARTKAAESEAAGAEDSTDAQEPAGTTTDRAETADKPARKAGRKPRTGKKEQTAAVPQ